MSFRFAAGLDAALRDNSDPLRIAKIITGKSYEDDAVGAYVAIRELYKHQVERQQEHENKSRELRDNARVLLDLCESIGRRVWPKAEVIP